MPINTAISSVIEAVQLLTGSGLVLIIVRVPALVKCVAEVSPPPITIPTVSLTGPNSAIASPASSAPSGMRIKV